MTQGRESNNYRVVKTIKERRKGMDKDGGRERGEKKERERKRMRERGGVRKRPCGGLWLTDTQSGGGRVAGKRE